MYRRTKQTRPTIKKNETRNNIPNNRIHYRKTSQPMDKPNKRKNNKMANEETINEEDYNFDFTQYETEIEEETQTEDITQKPPPVSGYRSRFSNHIGENEQLIRIKDEIIKYSLETASGTQDINTLRKHLAALYTYWTCFKDIGGQNIQTQINQLINKCRTTLDKQQGKKLQYEKVHAWILYLQEQIFRLRQIWHLGFEIEKTYRGELQKAKGKIIEG